MQRDGGTALERLIPSIEIPGFQVFGPPATKKTSNRVVSIPKRGSRACPCCGHRPGFPKVLPSEQYETWLENALYQMVGVKAKLAARGVSLPIAGTVSIEAIIYRASNTTGDLTGYLQAIGDMLQEAKVLINDRQIEDFDGSRRKIDAARPRVEIYLTVIEPRAVQEDLPL